MPSATSANILLLFPDQWRGDCLGHLGHPVAYTPYADRLAEEGASFVKAYSPSPSCVPARACLATGMAPWRSGRLGYEDGQPWPYRRTLPQRLLEAGWQTMQVGKTHFHPMRLRLGFEESLLYEASVREPGFCSDYHAFLAAETGGRVRDPALLREPNGLVAEPWTAEPRLHCTEWIADQAVQSLQRRDPTRPFFLQVGFHRPHPPLDPPVEWWRRFADASLPPVPVGDWVGQIPARSPAGCCGPARLPSRELDQARRAYLAAIAHVDAMIGRLMMALRQQGLLDSTWVILASDHGEMLGDHHHVAKFLPYEGSARIPLVIRPPTGLHLPRGQRIAAPVTLTDLMPTCLAIAGQQPDATCDGRSLLPCLEAGGGEGPHRWIHIEHSGWLGHHHALCDGRWKYCWESGKGRELLFDLAEDPQELLDRSTAAAEQTALWRQRLVEHLAPRNDGLVQDGRLATGIRLDKTAAWLRAGREQPEPAPALAT